MFEALHQTGLGDEWYQSYYDAAMRSLGVLVPVVGVAEAGRETGQVLAQSVAVPPGQNRDAYNPLFWGPYNLTNASTDLFDTTRAAVQGVSNALTPSGWSWTTIALLAVGTVVVIVVASKK